MKWDKLKFLAALTDDSAFTLANAIEAGFQRDPKVRRVLSPKEEQICTLLRNAGATVTRAALRAAVFPDSQWNCVDVYISYIRKKLGAEVIETVRGVGYKWKGES